MLGSSKPRKFHFSARFVDTDLPRPRWRFTGQYQFHPRFSAGAEYNAVAGEFAPNANLTLFFENRTRPFVNLGTSSDRIGSPEGNQAYFLTAGKTIPQTPLAPYVSLMWSTWDDQFNVPFGCNVQVHERIGILPMYDGAKGHLLLNYSGHGYGFSLMWIWFERAGVAVNWGF